MLHSKITAFLFSILLTACSPSTSSIANSNPLVEAARAQIGVVTAYDTSYYQGGYPPENRGACTDVIARAFLTNNYDLKAAIDQDVLAHPARYPDGGDSNIDFRRVRNVQIFLENYAEKLPTCITADCFNSADWQPGDIVTFDQIPNSLWHIAIISDKTKKIDGLEIPLLIHNYGNGVVEDNRLLDWPAPITGHYRMQF